MVLFIQFLFINYESKLYKSTLNTINHYRYHETFLDFTIVVPESLVADLFIVILTVFY